MERLVQVLFESPEAVLKQLANSAVDLCGADSSGISIELHTPDDDIHYHWVATAGVYGKFLDAMLPRVPSACGACLDRGSPQLIRASQVFFDLIGSDAPIVTDGLLLPWQSGETRGTIWILAHGRNEAFDHADLDLMVVLARFAALGVAQQEKQTLQYEQWAANAASAVVDLLALRVREPVQRIADLAFTAAHGKYEGDAKALAREMAGSVDTLTQILNESLGRSADMVLN